MKVIDICEAENASFEVVQQALANLQLKGMIVGFVPNDPEAEIVLTGYGMACVDDLEEVWG